MITFLQVLRMTTPISAPLLLGLAITGVALLTGNAAASHSPTPPDFKVAFIGDQGLGSSALAVLNLIKDEGTDMVLHQGDMGYTDDADAWDQQISDVLGNEFPYFASIGNHDCIGSVGCDGPGQWSGYQQKLLARLDQVNGATCTGDLGVNSGLLLPGAVLPTLRSGHSGYRSRYVHQRSASR